MDAHEVFQYQWPYLLSLLPPIETLESGAYSSGALSRRRSIDSASTLLRLALAYSFCGFSLRQTTAWAEACGLASLSDVALLKRLRKCHTWLGQLLAAKLADRAAPPTSSLRLRLLDATAVSQPGSSRADWRIHLSFDLGRMMIDSLDLSDFSGAESLTRFHLLPNELAVADCGYAHRAGLFHVTSSGAHYLVRINWLNIPLLRLDHSRLDVLACLRSLPEAMAGSFPVLVAPDRRRQIPAFPARLVAVRRSEAAAESARQRAAYNAHHQRHLIDPRTLESAGYAFALTSLPDSYDAAQILDIYRFRWQIELAFKRLKSILHLDELPAKDPALAKTILYSKLLAALLVEDFATNFLAISPWGYNLRST